GPHVGGDAEDAAVLDSQRFRGDIARAGPVFRRHVPGLGTGEPGDLPPVLSALRAVPGAGRHADSTKGRPAVATAMAGGIARGKITPSAPPACPSTAR